MEPLRVLHFPGIFTSGGVETVLMNWYRNIDRSKIQFDFCVTRNMRQPIDDEVEILGGRIIYMPRIKHLGVIKSVFEIKRIIERYGPYKSIHIHSVHAGLIPLIASFLAGIKKRIYHVHSTQDLALKNIRFGKVLESSSSLLINFLSSNRFACSIDAGKYVYGHKPFEVINNAIDLNRFRPWDKETREKQRKYFNCYSNDIVVGYVARFVDGKNHELLLDIAECAKEKGLRIKFLLVGDGPKKGLLEKEIMVRKLSAFFELLGFIKETEKVYNSLDIFCVPSQFEGFSLVTLEAQACGIPCLISNGVPLEVAIGVVPVCQENLNSQPSVWLNRLLSLKEEKIDNIEKIREVFTNKGYELSTVVGTLESVYLSF